MRAYLVIVSALLSLCNAFRPNLTPPKRPFTPFFNLQVASSPNRSLVGWWVTTPTYGSYLQVTPNRTARAPFYTTGNWTNNEHPAGGPVLVRNVTDAVPYGEPGTPYTPRNLIAGTSSGLTGVPIEASVFTKSQPDWDDFGSYELDFRLGPPGGRVGFNAVAGGPLLGWNKTSACWFDVFGFEQQRFVLLNYYPGPASNCSEVHLKWVFAGL